MKCTRSFQTNEMCRLKHCYFKREYLSCNIHLHLRFLLPCHAMSASQVFYDSVPCCVRIHSQTRCFFFYSSKKTLQMFYLSRALKNRLRKTLENKLCCAVRSASYSLCEYRVLRNHVNERLEATLNKKKESRQFWLNLERIFITGCQHRPKIDNVIDKSIAQTSISASILHKFNSIPLQFKCIIFLCLSVSAYVLRVWRDQFT